MSLSPERWRAIIRGSAGGPSALVLRRLMWLARIPYGVGVWWRNRRFDRGRNVHRVGVPVISVGNLTLGGTGKTPCVEYIARLFREHDHLVAILSRGYGARPAATMRRWSWRRTSPTCRTTRTATASPSPGRPSRNRRARCWCWTTASSTAAWPATWTSC